MMTPRLVLFQALLVILIWGAGQFGKKPLVALTFVLILLTVPRIGTPAIMILQLTVILATAAVRYHKIREREATDMLQTIRSLLDRLSGKSDGK